MALFSQHKPWGDLNSESLGSYPRLGLRFPMVHYAGDGCAGIGCVMNLTFGRLHLAFLQQPSVSEELPAWSIEEMRGDRTDSQ